MAYPPQIDFPLPPVKGAIGFPDDPVSDLYAGTAPPWGDRPVNLRALRPQRAAPTAGTPKAPGKRALAAAADLAAPRKRHVNFSPQLVGTTKMSESKPGITLVSWRPFEKNTLRGFATIAFPMGLVIRDITVHEKNGKTWVGMPAKVQLDAEGQIRRKPDGKPEYAAVLEWSDRELAERFGARVIALVEDRHGPIA